MKIKKFLIWTNIITVFCLGYIDQQTQIFKMGYEGKRKHDLLTELLDQKEILVYNIDVLKSLPNIQLNLLSKQKDFEIAREYHIVKLTGTQGAFLGAGVQNVLMRLLSLRLPWLVKQAEAKTIERP